MDAHLVGKKTATLKSSPMMGIFMGLFICGTLLVLSLFMPFLLIIAIPSIILSPVMGILAKSGKCPNCNSTILFPGTLLIKCRSCKHRIKRDGNIAYDVT